MNIDPQDVPELAAALVAAHAERDREKFTPETQAKVSAGIIAALRAPWPKPEPAFILHPWQAALLESLAQDRGPRL